MAVAELRKQIPYGEPGNINALARKRAEQLVIFSPVKNLVERVNQDILFPFNIKKSLPTNLGSFASETYREQKIEEGGVLLEYWERHHRSAIVGRIIFGDTQGAFYRDVDLKGGGLILGDGIADLAQPGSERGNGDKEGLLTMEDAINDYERAEHIHSLGIRVVRPIAIIKLDELIVRQKRLTIEQSIAAGIIDRDTEPVLIARAFGVRTRLRDLTEQSRGEVKEVTDKNKILISDAKVLVSQELGLDHVMSDQEYFDWFVETHTKNTALLHKNGILHKWLTTHNVTLDCRMADFDDTKKLETEKEWRSEHINIKDNLAHLGRVLGLIPEENSLSFYSKLEYTVDERYDELFSAEERESYFSKQNQAQ